MPVINTNVPDLFLTSPIPVIRAFFGEKHGKSYCDGFFGSHKQLIKCYMQQKSETGSLPSIAVTDARSFQYVSDALYGKKHHDENSHTAQAFIHIEKRELRLKEDLEIETVPETSQFHTVSNTGKRMELLS